MHRVAYSVKKKINSIWYNYIININIRKFIKNYTSIHKATKWPVNQVTKNSCLDNFIS